MDILDRYLGYEAWTLRQMISRCQELSTAQLHQSFDIGHNTVHETLEHTIGNIETWTDLMRQRSVRQLPPMPDNVESYLQRFDAAMADFSDIARTLAAQDHLDATYRTYSIIRPKPKPLAERSCIC